MKPLVRQGRLTAAISDWPDGPRVWIAAYDLTPEDCLDLSAWLDQVAGEISHGKSTQRQEA